MQRIFYILDVKIKRGFAFILAQDSLIQLYICVLLLAGLGGAFLNG